MEVFTDAMKWNMRHSLLIAALFFVWSVASAQDYMFNRAPLVPTDLHISPSRLERSARHPSLISSKAISNRSGGPFDLVEIMIKEVDDPLVYSIQ